MSSGSREIKRRSNQKKTRLKKQRLNTTIMATKTGQVGAMVVDLPSLNKVQVCLLSQPRLIPLMVLASPSDISSQQLREMNQQYSPLHVVQLPLLPVRPLAASKIAHMHSSHTHNRTRTRSRHIQIRLLEELRTLFVKAGADASSQPARYKS